MEENEKSLEQTTLPAQNQNQDQEQSKNLSTKWGTFQTLTEVFDFFLHKPNISNSLIWEEIPAELGLDKLEVLTTFISWANDNISTFFDAPKMGGKVIVDQRDVELALIIKYFFEIVRYSPDKVYLVFNKHNATTVVKSLSEVGIGTMMLFHSLRAI